MKNTNVIWTFVVAMFVVGCGISQGEQEYVGGFDTDTDTSSDSDTDTDADTDSDSDSDTDTDTDSDSDSDSDTDTGNCTPGDAQCDGNTAMNCGSDGAWDSEDCGEATCTIIDGQAVCYEAGLCDDSYMFCEGNTLMECVEGSDPAVDTQCGALGLFCDEAVEDCVECNSAHPCDDGYECVANECVEIDPCADVICNSPPDNTCFGGDLRVYESIGTCSDGDCNYDYEVQDCGTAGCDVQSGDDECVEIDPCADVICNDSPDNACVSGDLRVYESIGTCSDGVCNYSYEVQDCGTAGCDVQSGDDECAEETECTDGEVGCHDGDAAICIDGYWAITDNCTSSETCVDNGSTASCVSEGTECDEDNDWYCPEGQACEDGFCVDFAAECDENNECPDGQVCWITSTHVSGDFVWRFNGVCGDAPSGLLAAWDRRYRDDSGNGTCGSFGSSVWSPELIVDSGSLPSDFECSNGMLPPVVERCVPLDTANFTNVYSSAYGKCVAQTVDGFSVKSYAFRYGSSSFLD